MASYKVKTYLAAGHDEIDIDAYFTVQPHEPETLEGPEVEHDYLVSEMADLSINGRSVRMTEDNIERIRLDLHDGSIPKTKWIRIDH